MTLLALALTSASAQELATDRLLVPSAGIAAENGPGALWVNPANLAYDSDARFGVFFAGQPDAPLVGDEAGARMLAATAGVGGLSVGVTTVARPDERPEWALDYATSLSLPERVSLGYRASWHLVSGSGNNYVGHDFGGSWRPLPWLGFGAVARNIGSPDPSGRAFAESGGGIAVRPFEELAVLGADAIYRFDPTRDPLLVRGSARIRPLEGLYLRGSVDSELTWGAGIELYFDGVGVGGHGSLAEGVPVTAWVGTDEPGESLFRSGRRVPSLSLYAAPAYEPRATLFSDAGASWLDTLELMRRAESDRGVRGMVISLGDVGLSWAQYQELRTRIAALEDAGKPVLVYLYGSPSNGAYWAASAASHIALHPAGGLDLTGLAASMTYFRGTLDRLGVQAEFVKRSEYKSAPEANTHTEPTPPSLEQTNALLDDVYAELVAGISEGRGVTPDAVRGWIDGGPYSADEALAEGMADLLLYPDEIEDQLEEIHDGSVNVPDLYAMPQPRSAWEAPAQIAVVYVAGAIVSGPSSSGGLFGGATAGSWTVVNQLEQAMDDAQVRAVVLRVDSPGGSAFASDEIWRAVERVKEEGKPVVVSMGGVAASGGYYVSAGADAIWAEPTTITGSIGVYSGKFATGELMDRLGVTTTTIQRGRNAGIYSSTRTWDERERARMESLVEQTYVQFKSRVEGGRSLTADQVEEVARGRVWTGRRALEVGLVDEIGGLQDAIADARARAGLAPHREVALVSYSPYGLPFESLAPSLVKLASRIPAVKHALRSPELAALGRQVPAEQLAPWLVWAAHPEESVWMMDPWIVEIGPR